MENNKTVVAITGAYSGLGAALARRFAERGCGLVLAGRDAEKLDAFAASLNTEAVCVVADIRRKEDCENIVKAAVDNFGKLDAMINNAGVWWIGKIDDISEGDVSVMFETNTFGPLWCTKAALAVMQSQGKQHDVQGTSIFPCIVNVCSTAAIDFKSSHLLYCASKHALIGLTGCLAEDMKDSGVRVIAFCPGGMKTDLFRKNPERMRDDFMDPDYAAKRLVEFIESGSKEWLFILRRWE